MSKIKNEVFGVLVVFVLFVTPLLYTSWQKEKERANEFQELFFYCWDEMKKVEKGESKLEYLLEYLEEIRRHEEMMNELAGEISKSYKREY